MNFVDIYQKYWKNGYVLTDQTLSGIDREMFRSLFNPVAEVFRKYPAGDCHLYTFGPGVPILGPELVVNGDFSSGATWWNLVNPVAGSVSVSNGGVRINSTDGSNGYFQHTGVNLVAGKSYMVQFDVTAWVAGTAGFTSDGGTVQFASAAGVGKYSAIVVAQGAAIVQLKRVSGVTDITVDNISVKEILGYSNTYSGFTAGNYFDSSGTTYASVDGSVGLVLDAAGSVGAELAPPIDATWTRDATVSVVGNTFVYANTPAANNGAYKAVPLTTGKTYRVTLTVSGYVSGSISAWLGNQQTGASNAMLQANGTLSFLVSPTVAYNGYFLVGTNTGTTSATVSLVSIKEITGIHATQSTPGYKPTLRKGIVNLLTWSNDRSQWSAINATYVPGQLAPDGGYTATRITQTASGNQGYYRAGWTLQAGAIYTSYGQMKAVSGGNNLMFVCANQSQFGGTGGDRYVIFNGADGSFVSKSADVSAYSILPIGNGFWLVSATYTQTATSTGVVAFYGTTNNQSFDAGAAGISPGTLTATQIIAAGGIPLTTTAPASSQAGVNYLEFDGVDDRIIASSLNTDTSGLLVVGATPKATGWRMVAGSGAQTGSNAGVRLGIDGGNGQWVFDTASGSGFTHSYSVDVAQINTPVVLSGRWVQGGQQQLRLNSVLKSSGSSVASPSSQGFALGAGQYAAGQGDYFNGNIHCVLAIKGTVSDADLAVLEKFVAQLSGVPL